MKATKILTLALVLVMCFSIVGCDILLGGRAVQLTAPTNVRVDGSVLSWNFVEHAIGYTVKIVDGENADINTAVGQEIPVGETQYSLASLKDGKYTLGVKARGDSMLYSNSAYASVQYTHKSESGESGGKKEVMGAFGSFDEINTKNSFLGYGIDIINASAVTSKNVMLTYPIFDMDKLMDETLLKSNEHYNSFESIEGLTIESFIESMSNSTSITAGSNVSAKGKVYGVKLGASVSMSGGLSTSFTKTSEATESQYFMEVIAENQSYWLILQTSEQRYKDILSEEFKRDLYDTSITPAQLFSKYGTHLLTSVAMGGNICMYYTMFSYDNSVTASDYAKVSAALKSNVEASYGRKASGGNSQELTFESAYTYEALASSLGIYIDKKIVSAGGGSYGINNEQTLFDNYFDWQKSLDTYPVVIGIKDSNSLYPVWELLDLNVDGAAERYAELYGYFAEYGANSYNKLCETYSITPAVAPSGITNIKVGDVENYTEGEIVQVKAGDILRISFDVQPDNANKYTKTFAVNDTALATVDSTGVLTVSPSAKGGNYITVTIMAGTVSKQITLYVVNTFSVTFNTRVSGINVPPIVGVLEGYSIDEPTVKREGYRLEGWYTDSDNTNRFDFENDSVNSHLTLYAKWVAIKPVVTFNSNGGSAIDSVTVAYQATVVEPKAPMRSGYIFGGWYADEDFTVPFDFATLLTDDTTLYARWAKITYNVSFVTNGGTPVADVTTSITEDYKVVEPKTSRTYYDIEGWYLDEHFTYRFYFETEVTEDTTLYAKWNAAPAYIHPVDSDGSSSLYDEWGMAIGVYSTDATRGFKATVPTPYKEGYTFVGWYINGKKIDIDSYDGFKPRTDEYKIVARWEVNTHKVTYILDGFIYHTEDYKYGEEIQPLIVDSIGYAFSGWKYGNKPVPSVMPDRDIELTSSLTPKQYKISYYVDGILYAEKTYTYGEEIEYIAEPTEIGKEFSGWIYSGGELPTTMPAEDVRIDGAFDQVEFTVTYYVDGEPKENYKVFVGFEIPVYTPEKVGHTFSGWVVKDGEEQSLLPELMPACNLNVYGSFSINEYIITVDTNGGNSISPIKQDYGTVVSKLTDPTREGYTFIGWSRELPSTMPAENITIKALWSINSYTIVFNSNGGSTVDSITLNYGEPITKPDDPTWQGHTFTGWDKAIPLTMPAENMVITAIWEINTYTVKYHANKPDCGCAISGSMGDSTFTYNVSESLRHNAYSIVGHTFLGWATTPGGNVVYSNGQKVNNLTTDKGTINLYAKWSKNVVSITYYIDSSEKTGSFSIYDNVTEATYHVTRTFSKASCGSYSFVGWFTSDGVQITDSNSKLLSNVSGYTDGDGCFVYSNSSALNLYARWTAGTYQVVYNANGGSGTMSNSTFSIDSSASLASNKFQRNGYAFAGWSTSVGESVVYKNSQFVKNLTINKDSSVTLYAIWIKTETAIILGDGKSDRHAIRIWHSWGHNDDWCGQDVIHTELNRDELLSLGYTKMKVTMTFYYRVDDWGDQLIQIFSNTNQEVTRFTYEWDERGWTAKTVEYELTLNGQVDSDCGFWVKWYLSKDGTNSDTWFVGGTTLVIEAS